MNNQTTELTVEQLSDELEMLYWVKGTTTLQVNEHFNKNGDKYFRVKHLEMDVENDIIFCDDEEHKIIKKKSVLMGFVTDCLKCIHRIVVNGQLIFDLEFMDGEIILQAVLNVR